MRYLILLNLIVFNSYSDDRLDLNHLRITIDEKREDLALLRDVYNEDKRISCSRLSGTMKDAERCRSLHKSGDGYRLFRERERGLLHEIERLSFVYEELVKESGNTSVVANQAQSLCEEVTSAYVICNGTRYVPDTSQVDILTRDADKIIPQVTPTTNQRNSTVRGQ